MALLMFNLSITNALSYDTDNDGIDDAVDNCINTPNHEQSDTDGDGYGNRCDADYNNNCLADFGDYSLFRSQFRTSSFTYDLNGDGDLDVVDFKIFKDRFALLGPPGPSNTGNCQPPP